MTGSSTFSKSYYHQVYHNYTRQNPPKKIEWYRSIVQSVLPDIPSPFICDIGCAFGSAVHSFEKQWFTCGFDVSLYSVKKAISKSSHNRIGLASCTKIPLKDQSMHIITAFDVLEHIEDIELCAHEILRVLKPGGSIIFTVPVYDGPLGLVVRSLDRDPTHCHKKSRTFWISFAKKYFTSIEWIGALRYLLPFDYYLHIHSIFFRNYSPAILITGHKNH